MHPRHFRIRFLLGVARPLLLPQIVPLVLLRLLPIHDGLWMRLVLHALSVPIFAYIKGLYISRVQSTAAYSLNAVPITRVIGKWPGNIDILLRTVQGFKTGYLMQFWADLFEEYDCKTLNLRLLWDDMIITIDESHIKFMLAGPGFEWFGKGFWWQERMESFLGDGIFNRDGKTWQMHRSIARPFFAKERVTDFDIFEQRTNNAVSLISGLSGPSIASSQAFDAQDLFSRLSLDISSEFLFGFCLDTLSRPLPIAGKALLGPKGSATDDEFGTFSSAFESVQVVVALRTRIGKIWPLFELFKDRTSAYVDIIHGWLKPIVEGALKEREAIRAGLAKSEADKETFLGHLADVTDDAEMVRYQILNMLVAGRDTTSALLTFVVYFLSLHPSVLARLRAEVLEHHGPDGRPTYESLNPMKYMRAVLNETLRLFPPVPMNIRTSDNFPRAFPSSRPGKPNEFLPPSTQIIYSSLLVQRREDLWGDDSNLFNPDRWIDPDRVKNVTRNPFMFIPFHAGPRTCLGQNFAYQEASFVLVRLLQRFERLSLAPEYQPDGSIPPSSWSSGKGRQAIERCWPASSVTLFVKGGLWVKFLPVSNQG